jgi:hypothetical protein
VKANPNKTHIGPKPSNFFIKPPFSGAGKSALNREANQKFNFCCNYSAGLYETSFPHVFSGNPASAASVDARPQVTFGHAG